MIEIDINKLKKYLSFLVINSHSPSFKSLKKSTIMNPSDSENDEDIVGFRKQPRYTNVNFRSQLALKANAVPHIR